MPSRPFLATALLAFGSFGIYLFILMNPARYQGLLMELAADPLFLDLHCLIASIDGYKQGIDVMTGINPLDFYGRGHAYSPLWLDFYGTIFEMRWMGELAFLFTLLFLGTAILVVRPANFLAAGFTLALLASPAVALGLERLNSDIMIFPILFLPFFLPSTQTSGKAVVQWLTCFFGTLLKYYPAAAFSLFVTTLEDRRSFLLAAGTAMVAGMGFFLIYGDDILRSVGIMARPYGLWAFGRDSIFFQTLTFETAEWVFMMMAGLLILGAVSTTLAFPVLEYGPAHPRSEALFISGAFIYVLSFLANTNFDYRLIYLIPTLPYLFWLIRRPGWRYPVLLLFVCMFLMSWSEWWFYHFIFDTYQAVYINHLRAFLYFKGGLSWTILGFFLFLISAQLRNHLGYKFQFFNVRWIRSRLNPQKPA